MDQWLSPKGVGFSSHFLSPGLARVTSLMLWYNTLQSRVWTIWGGVVLRYIALADGENCFAENYKSDRREDSRRFLR